MELAHARGASRAPSAPMAPTTALAMSERVEVMTRP
jgi:hypothetical protein